MQKTLLITCAIMIFLTAGPKAAEADYEIPEEVQASADKYAEEYDISPEILLAIMNYESCYIPDVSNGNCKGLMQINEKVHQDRIDKLGVTDLYDIDSNIHVGADLIAELYEQYGDYGIVLGLYHGEKKAISNGRKGIYSSYTKKVLNRAAILEKSKDTTDGNQ